MGVILRADYQTRTDNLLITNQLRYLLRQVDKYKSHLTLSHEMTS